MATDPNSKARRSVQRPSTKSMRHPGIRHDGLNRASTRSAMEEMKEVRQDKQMEFLTGTGLLRY